MVACLFSHWCAHLGWMGCFSLWQFFFFFIWTCIAPLFFVISHSSSDSFTLKGAAVYMFSSPQGAIFLVHIIYIVMLCLSMPKVQHFYHESLCNEETAFSVQYKHVKWPSIPALFMRSSIAGICDSTSNKHLSLILLRACCFNKEGEKWYSRRSEYLFLSNLSIISLIYCILVSMLF